MLSTIYSMFFAQAFLLLVISSVMALPGGHFHSPHPYGHNGHVHDNGDNHDHDNGDDAYNGTFPSLWTHP